MKKLSLENLNRHTLQEYQNITKRPINIVLDNIRSAHNVGSFFRTSDAFCIKKIWCCGFTPVPPHREILKTALGAQETVEWEYAKEIVPLVENLSTTQDVWAVEQTDNSIMLNDFELPKPMEKDITLVFGNEVEGVTEEIFPHLKGAIEIPQWGVKHSINVSVCGGVVLWDILSKLSHPK